MIGWLLPVAHDPTWASAAEDHIRRLQRAMGDNGLTYDGWTWHHIGSTAVPQLLAKPIIDLQIGVSALPDWGDPVDLAIQGCGWQQERGSRPDSPGVERDEPLPGVDAPVKAYYKRLYSRAGGILHVRLLASPWTTATVRFRDLLRSDVAIREAYAEVKRVAAETYADAPDYDDYTRAKSVFFAPCPDAPFAARRLIDSGGWEW